MEYVWEELNYMGGPTDSAQIMGLKAQLIYTSPLGK